MNKNKKCCNICGKEMKESGLDREDFVVLEKKWGYFSEKDGEFHRIVMCEKCYDLWITSFRISPLVEEYTEYLS